MRLVDLMTGAGCSGYEGCTHKCSGFGIGSMSGSLVVVDVETNEGSSNSAKTD